MTLYALSTAVAVWWAGAYLWETGALLAFASLLLGRVAAIVARRARSGPALRLAWDGSAWRLHPPGSEGPAGRVALMLDLGGGASWLPQSRRDDACAWPALWVALQAPQPVQPTA